MGRASRLKRERAAPPPPRSSGGASSKVVWLVTAGLAVAIAVVVGVLVATRSGGSEPPPPAAGTDNGNAPAALVQAADEVGFKPTTAPGLGQIEDEPASAGQPPANPDLLAVGTQAPGFSLKTPQGETVSLSDFEGKAVLLEFFATWCPHCQAEAPHLKALAESLPASRYAFVSVNADGEDAASVFAYERYFGLPFPSLLDPSSKPGSFHQPGAPGPVSTAYRVAAYPTFYVVDPEGRITWRSDGEQPDALLRQELARAAKGG